MATKRKSFGSKLLRLCAAFLAILIVSITYTLISMPKQKKLSDIATEEVQARLAAFEKSAELPDQNDASPSECLEAAQKMRNLIRELYRDAGICEYEHPVAEILCENTCKYQEWVSLYLLKESSSSSPDWKKIEEILKFWLHYPDDKGSSEYSDKGIIISQYSMRIGENLYYATLNMHNGAVGNKEIIKNCLSHAIEYLQMTNNSRSYDFLHKLYTLQSNYYRK